MTTSTKPPPLHPAGLHLDQLAGAWACEEARFRALAGAVRAFPASELAAAERPAKGKGAELPYARRGAIAVVDLVGPMTKYPAWFGALEDGTLGVRRAIRTAAADPEVDGILLRVDSPGGTVAGTDDLADDVFRAAKIKPLIAYIEDLGASAAYYVASQAGRVYANASALVGSIGTYLIVEDWSQAADAQGVKVHVLRAGDFKGAGTVGTEVTEAQLADFQRIVNEVNEQFLRAVVRGRPELGSTIRQVADGRVHSAPNALHLRLIDEIVSLDGAFSRLEKWVESGVAPAVAVDLHANCVPAPAVKTQTTPRERSVKAVSQTAIELWNQMLAELRARGLRRDQAVRELATKHPQLHRQYIEEYNRQARAGQRPGAK